MAYRSACDAVKSSLSPKPYEYKPFKIEIKNPDGFEKSGSKQTAFAIFEIRLHTESDASRLFSLSKSVVNLELVESDKYNNVTAIAWAHSCPDKSKLGSHQIVSFFRKLLSDTCLLVKDVDYFQLPE